MEIGLFIKRSIGFVLFAFLFYIIGVIVYGEFLPQKFQYNIFYEKFAYGFSNTRFKEVNEIDNVDTLFLGSSRAYRHYDPRTFEKAGYSSFNMGSSSQTFLQTEILVKRYLETLNPKYVILDVYPGAFSSDGSESSLDLISNDYNSWDTLKLAISLKNIKVLNTWIYAIYKEYFFKSLEEREELTKGVNKYISGGFVERDVERIEIHEKLNQQWKYNKDQWESFEEILTFILESESKLIVLHSPLHNSISYSNTERLTEYLRLRNIPYHNYKNLIFINDSLHFYDA
ncbi:hypothetical protein VS868_14015 [Salinimicrobium sp. 3283s]|uniref:hypothetical protein n=1 Tax=Salinimicrobium sp. 3283s TaxID=3114359 RepID=UPI0031F0F8CA